MAFFGFLRVSFCGVDVRCTPDSRSRLKSNESGGSSTLESRSVSLGDPIGDLGLRESPVGERRPARSCSTGTAFFAILRYCSYGSTHLEYEFLSDVDTDDIFFPS